MRSAQLAKIGGRIVYSTCSLNPIENEAIVCDLMRQWKGALKIVDCSSMFPTLIRRPAMTSWKVFDKTGNQYDTYEDVPEKFQGIVFRSMFPPDIETSKSYDLEHAMRFMPHDQDTGGFFVCVFEKSAEWNYMSTHERLAAKELRTAQYKTKNSAETSNDDVVVAIDPQMVMDAFISLESDAVAMSAPEPVPVPVPTPAPVAASAEVQEVSAVVADEVKKRKMEDEEL